MNVRAAGNKCAKLVDEWIERLTSIEQIKAREIADDLAPVLEGEDILAVLSKVKVHIQQWAAAAVEVGNAHAKGHLSPRYAGQVFSKSGTAILIEVESLKNPNSSAIPGLRRILKSIDQKTIETRETYRQQLGERLRALRGSRPQRSFASLHGIGFTTYRRYESGIREPEPSWLVKVAAAEDVSPNWLIVGRAP